MRYFLFISIIIFTFWTHLIKGQTNTFVNPSGLYKYDGKTYKKNGNTYGYFGTIKVLLLDTNKILMSFYVCKGAPSYNSGSFVDTLDYSNNQAVYRGDTTMVDLSCRLIFHFTSKGIDAELFSDNPNWACGFGQGVDAQGFYKRVKGKIPTKEDILKDDE